MKINELLKLMVGKEASDLYLQIGSLPCLRINGDLIPLEKEAPFQTEDMEKVFKAILSEKQKERLWI